MAVKAPFSFSRNPWVNPPEVGPWVSTTTRHNLAAAVDAGGTGGDEASGASMVVNTPLSREKPWAGGRGGKTSPQKLTSCPGMQGEGRGWCWSLTHGGGRRRCTGYRECRGDYSGGDSRQPTTTHTLCCLPRAIFASFLRRRRQRPPLLDETASLSWLVLRKTVGYS